MKCMCHWKNRLILQTAYPPVLVEAGGSSVLTQEQGKRSQVSPAEAWLWRQNPEALCVAEEVPKHPRPRAWAQLGWYFWDCNHTQQWDTVYDSSLRGNSATIRRKLWVHCLASQTLNSWYKVRIIILSCVTSKEGKNPRGKKGVTKNCIYKIKMLRDEVRVSQKEVIWWCCVKERKAEPLVETALHHHGPTWVSVCRLTSGPHLPSRLCVCVYNTPCANQVCHRCRGQGHLFWP